MRRHRAAIALTLTMGGEGLINATHQSVNLTSYAWFVDRAFNSEHGRAQLAQIFDLLEPAVLLAVLDDPRRSRRANAWQHL
jgi:hypothetical protein